MPCNGFCEGRAHQALKLPSFNAIYVVGQLRSLRNVDGALAINLTTDMIWYNASDNHGPPPEHLPVSPSGAYIFNTNGFFAPTPPFSLDVLRGHVVTEIRQVSSASDICVPGTCAYTMLPAVRMTCVSS